MNELAECIVFLYFMVGASREIAICSKKHYEISMQAQDKAMQIHEKSTEAHDKAMQQGNSSRMSNK